MIVKSASLLAGAGMVLASCASRAEAANAQAMSLTSTTFKDGTMMPKKVANKNAGKTPTAWATTCRRSCPGPARRPAPRAWPC